MTEQVKLTKSGLQADKDANLTTEEMAAKYNLPLNQMRKALKLAGIKTRAKTRDKFVLIDDTTMTSNETLNDALVGIKESTNLKV